jgi:hypothetical protein
MAIVLYGFYPIDFGVVYEHSWRISCCAKWVNGACLWQPTTGWFS